MRLDHLLSRDLGACGGRGARTGAPPGSSRGPSGGRTNSTGARSPLTLRSAGCVGGACLLSAVSLRVCVGCGGGGGGGMLSGSGAACPLCPASASSCCVGGCGGVGGLVVNCIVDASIFVLCGVFLLCASRPGPAALFVVWWVLGVVCLCCVLFLWAFGGCLGTRGR